jgi:hypothetical protein
MKRYDKYDYLTNKMNKKKIEDDKVKEDKTKKDKAKKPVPKVEKKVKSVDSEPNKKPKKTKKEDIPITKNSEVRMKKSGVEVFPLSEKGGFVSSFSTQPHKISLWEKIKLFVKSFKRQ